MSKKRNIKTIKAEIADHIRLLGALFGGGVKEEPVRVAVPPPAPLPDSHRVPRFFENTNIRAHFDNYVRTKGTRILTMVSRSTLEQIVKDIMRDEGWSETPYQCTAGVWTIGWGRTGGITELTPATSKDVEMPHLLADIDTAITDADFLFANFRGLDPVRQGVLVNMAYNLGRSRLRKFVNFRNAVEREDFEAAALHMKQSRWYTQVGLRSKYLRERMRTGRIEPLHLATSKE